MMYRLTKFDLRFLFPMRSSCSLLCRQSGSGPMENDGKVFVFS